MSDQRERPAVTMPAAYLERVLRATRTYAVWQLGAFGENGALVYPNGADSPRRSRVAEFDDRHEAAAYARQLNAQAVVEFVLANPPEAAA